MTFDVTAHEVMPRWSRSQGVYDAAATAQEAATVSVRAVGFVTDPTVLLAVTTARSRLPLSAALRTRVMPVAPAIVVHVPPLTGQRCQMML